MTVLNNSCYQKLYIKLLPTAGIGGSLVLVFRICGPELAQGHVSLTFFSLSFLMFSSLMVTPPPLQSPSPTPAELPWERVEESTIGGSSSALSSPKLPPLCRAISTPLSLLWALPSGDGSLLHDEWPPGLDWYVWRGGQDRWFRLDTKSSLLRAFHITLVDLVRIGMIVWNGYHCQTGHCYYKKYASRWNTGIQLQNSD